MDLYKENTLTLRLYADGELGDEIKTFKSILRKVDAISAKAGFKRDFNPQEIDLVRTLHATLSKEEDRELKP